MWRLFWTKHLIVPSYSPHQIQNVIVLVISIAIILSEILNVKIPRASSLMYAFVSISKFDNNMLDYMCFPTKHQRQKISTTEFQNTSKIQCLSLFFRSLQRRIKKQTIDSSFLSLFQDFPWSLRICIKVVLMFVSCLKIMYCLRKHSFL